MAASVIDELRRIRTAQADEPERVVQLGRDVVSNSGKAAAGDEYWTILDQVAVAAMITNDDLLAKECLDELATKFPTSPRTYALLGMQLETQEKLPQAQKYYDHVLEGDQTNIMVWKRKAALLRSLNRPVDAISQLTLLLDSFPHDPESWAELSDLYISLDMYSQAAFCLEELLLLQPNSYFVHAQYAEIVWALGKEGTALKYWCRSVELCGEFFRGWFGLKTACKTLLERNGKGRGVQDEVDVPEKATLEKLDVLATSKLVQSAKLASPAEKSAAAKLLGQ